MDDHFHGTLVAAPIGAVGNNTLGIVGVNWHCKIVALRTINQFGIALVTDAIDAISYMIANDIKVSNNSYGWEYRSEPMEDNIEALQGIGHIFVAAAHNQGYDINPVCRPTSLQACCSDADCPVGETCDASNEFLAKAYPAAYCLDNIISVGASDNNDIWASFSNYGSTSVDLAAPGVNIYTTSPNSTYAFNSGTSLAAPHVTGVVGLVRSRMPNLSWQDVKNRILNNVRAPWLFLNISVTGGVVNAHASLLDCNSNGVDDQQDITSGTSQDCNANSFPDECEGDCNTTGIPDDCDITAGTSQDCNGNAIPDECESTRDCNSNGVLDFCDTAAGTSADCNNNEVPDECEPCPDCNANGLPDSCDLLSGTSQDCTGNGIPDECETDCNNNGIEDICDIDSGTSQDCNGNGVPDECDIGGGSSIDCNTNGIPDECEPDCNENDVADECDITSGTSQDCDANGVPDECEMTTAACCLISRFGQGYCVETTECDCQQRGGQFNSGFTCAQVYCAGTNGPSQGP